MYWDQFFNLKQVRRHKVFISYYHKEAEIYRVLFENMFGDLFINKSVGPGDINTDLSDEYIKRLIQQEFITDASVVLVLVGPKTFCRKHVDWEIYAALTRKVGGYSGLVGILLPEVILAHNRRIPLRLADNVKTGYAKLYLWNLVCRDKSLIRTVIEEAYWARVNKFNLINNSRPQLKYNLCE